MRTPLLLCAALTVLPAAPGRGADPGDLEPAIRAKVTLAARQVPLNHPVWAHFSVENLTDDPVTLTVPDTEPDLPSPEVGLPLSHVFSANGPEAGGVTVTTESGQSWATPVGYRKPERAPILLLAPKASVGALVDLRDLFPSLRSAGTFKIQWQPYAGSARGDSAHVIIAPRKQVEIVTDEGRLTIRLFYDEAPNHVENFLELAKSGFYNGLTFHRIEQGYLIQGGCPRGDGTGIRLDGKRIAAEPNDLPHKKGSVSMALLADDPDSASCQFFIANTRMKDWDGRYTVFGELSGDESLTTLDRLMQTPVDEEGRPQKPLQFRSVHLLDERS